MKNKIALFAFCTVMAGCSATTSMTAADNQTSIMINEFSPIVLEPGTGIEETYSTTSFGNYRYKITDSTTNETKYGLVPLKFNGGYLAADILFFAPAMFFNLREFYPYYEFNAVTGEVKYKKHEGDAWRIYVPSEDEVNSAKHYFSKRESNL
ncbi:hypothetical protein ABT56_01250 [Photobacterium aquae]|uniref:Lipoprotein n=1 Tax=Photobacterium aquae TaxID=1195763 RepID=A0A0J1HB58_9GAMM|nr:hypothetical protein [Photobacterium aquae]KLV08874.1 hypothetical protein ABT56_01250 [Photobacterium aquae]